MYTSYHPSDNRNYGRTIALWSWSGLDVNTPFRIAMREDGAFFRQEHVWNGFAMEWGSWRSIPDPRPWVQGTEIAQDQTHEFTGDFFWIPNDPVFSADSEYFLPGVGKIPRSDLSRIKLPTTPAISPLVY